MGAIPPILFRRPVRHHVWLSTKAKREAAAGQRDKRVTALIRQIVKASKELKLWRVTSAEIKRLIGSDKSEVAIGKALNKKAIRESLEDKGFAVADGWKDGCATYTVTPAWIREEDSERIREKVQSGYWSVTDDAKIVISADDYEATLPEWDETDNYFANKKMAASRS